MIISFAVWQRARPLPELESRIRNHSPELDENIYLYQ